MPILRVEKDKDMESTTNQRTAFTCGQEPKDIGFIFNTYNEELSNLRAKGANSTLTLLV